MPTPLGYYTLDGTLTDVNYGGATLTQGDVTFGLVKPTAANQGLTASQGGDGQSIGYEYASQGTVFGVFDVQSDGTIMGQYDGVNGVKVKQENGVLVLAVDQQIYTSTFNAFDSPIRLSVGWNDTHTALVADGSIVALIEAVPTLPAADFHVFGDSLGGNSIEGGLCFLAYYNVFLGARQPASPETADNFDLFAYGQIGEGDEFYTDVEFLLQGTNLTTDGSANAYLLTDIGGTATDTIQKFGTESIDTFAGGVKVNTPSADTYTWNAGDFTVEAWVYPTGGIPSGAGQQPTLVGLMNDTTNGHYWSFGLRSDKVRFAYNNGNNSGLEGGVVPANQWSHIAMTHIGGTITLYLNGVSVASAAVNGTPLFDNATPLVVGKYNSIEGDLYVDQVRISTMARYTQAFTPEASPFYPYAISTGLPDADELFTFDNNNYDNTGANPEHHGDAYGASPAIVVDPQGGYFLEVAQNAGWQFESNDTSNRLNVASGPFFLTFRCYIPSTTNVTGNKAIMTTSYDGDMIYLYANAENTSDQSQCKIGVGYYWGEKISSGVLTPRDQWFEIGIQRDQRGGIDDVQIFLNGDLIQTWTVTGRTFPEPWYFGVAVNVAEYLAARYDDIRLWKTEIVEPTEGYDPLTAYLPPGAALGGTDYIDNTPSDYSGGTVTSDPEGVLVDLNNEDTLVGPAESFVDRAIWFDVIQNQAVAGGDASNWWGFETGAGMIRAENRDAGLANWIYYVDGARRTDVDIAVAQPGLNEAFTVGVWLGSTGTVGFIVDGVVYKTYSGVTIPDPAQPSIRFYGTSNTVTVTRVYTTNGATPEDAWAATQGGADDPLAVGEVFAYNYINNNQVLTDDNILTTLGYNPVSDDAAFRAPSSWVYDGPNEAMTSSTEVPLTAKLTQDTWVSRDKHIHSNLGRADVRYGSLSYGGSASNLGKARPSGKISGTVVDEFSAPVSRMIKLADRRSGDLVAEQWADANGTYQFRDLSTTRLYTVIAHDYTGTYNAVIKDNVSAEVDPNP